MNNQIKLYKCYKGTCSRCLSEDNQFITEDEYSEMLDSGDKIQCPEGHLDCGIQELKQEDYPKPAKKGLDKKIIIIGSAVIVLGIFLFFIFSGKSKPEPKTPVAAPPVKETPVVEAPVATPTPAEPVTEIVAPEAPAPKAVEEVKSVTTKKAVANVATPKGTQTKKFPGGGKYVGEMKNGQMQGLGTFYYGQHELISPRDMKKRYAEAGDYLIGEFYEGKVVSGKLYDASNTLKEVIMIGR